MKWLMVLVAVLATALAYGQTRTLNGGCTFVFGADNAASALVDADIGPQADLCQVPDAATLIEVGIKADAGTPSVIAQRFRPNGGTTVDLTSSALASAAAGAFACSKVSGVPSGSGTTSVNGTTTCSTTLQNTSLSKGDIIRTKTGATASTAKRVTITVVWQW